LQFKDLDGNRDQGGKKVTLVSLNKLSQYCKKDEGNTTLPMEINDVVLTAILDSGVGLSIATKSILEKWEKPMIRRTRMHLQLA